jgi:regulatory protein
LAHGFFVLRKVFMAGTITGMKIQKRNKARVNVYVDDQYAFAVTVLVAATLKKGQYLSDADIEQFKSQDERHKAYAQALRYLSFRARSRQEMASHLNQKGYSPEVVAITTARLVDEGYLDDEAFARFWLEDRERFRPRGRQALRYELRQKGIADELIDNLVSNLDEDELAWAAVERKVVQWQNLGEKDFKKKIVGFLSRRGFNYEVSRRMFERAWSQVKITE